MIQPIGMMNGYSVGDRVEAYTVGNVTYTTPEGRKRVFDSVNATGIIVAFNPPPIVHDHWMEVVMLTDPDPYYENGRPTSYRFDQIRPEKTLRDRLDFWKSQVELSSQIIERRIHRRASRKGLAKLINLIDRESDLELVVRTTLALGMRLDRATERFEPLDSNVFTRVRGLDFGDRVKVRDTNNADNWIKDCVFLCQVRGWRFYKYPHGGSHAQPCDDVLPDPLVPKARSRAPIKV